MNETIISPINTETISNGYYSPEYQHDADSKANIDTRRQRIKTFCRIRPFDGVNKTFFKFTENTKEGINHFISINRSSIKDKSLENLGSRFKFDNIFDEEFTQIEVFQETCMDLIKELIDDKKSSILFTNGLNNSGKTYTVIGDIENPGLLPLSLRYVFDQVLEKKDPMIKMYCNYLEIHNDGKVYDLLSEIEDEIIEVKIPNVSRHCMYTNANYFKLNTIQDCSNAINLGNKRKRMNRCKAKSGTNYYNSSHSLSTTIFKIVLRFFENENNYEEASLVLLDIAHKDESKFVNISHLNEYDTKQHMKKKKDIEWQHESLCRMIKGLNIKKKQKNHYHTDFCDLTVLLKYYIFGEEKIVMISNINPDVEEAEENLKVLYMSTMFKNGIKMIEQINTKPFRLQKFSLNKRMKEMIKFNRLIKEKKGKEKNSTSEDDNFTNNKGIVRDKSYDKIENSYNKWDKDIPIHNDTHEDNEKNLLNSEKSQELSPIRLINDKDLKENIIKKDDKMTLITTADKSTAIPKDGILTLSKEEKNNLFNTLQKNAPKLEIKSYPVKNNLSLIFNNKLPSDNKKESNSTLDKENESYRLSITDIEQMKKDYENLQKKFEEQQRIVKLLLDNNNITDSNGISHKENLSKLIPNYHNKGHITTKKEIFEDVHKVIDKVIENPVYKDSLDLLSSALVDGYDGHNSSKPGDGKLYNIIIMNPSIQHFTIMNRDLANQSNHLDREKKEVGQLENEKIKKTKSDVNLLKENMMDNKCEKEAFLKENIELISIKEDLLEEKSATVDSDVISMKRMSLLPIDDGFFINKNKDKRKPIQSSNRSRARYRKKEFY